MADKLLKLIIVVLFISFRPVSSVEEPNSEGKLSYRVFMIRIFSGNFSSRRKNAFLLLGREPRANGLDMCVSVKKIDVNFCSGKKKRGRIFSFFNIFSFKGENVEVGFAQVSVLDNRFWIHMITNLTLRAKIVLAITCSLQG